MYPGVLQQASRIYQCSYCGALSPHAINVSEYRRSKLQLHLILLLSVFQLLTFTWQRQLQQLILEQQQSILMLSLSFAMMLIGLVLKRVRKNKYNLGPFRRCCEVESAVVAREGGVPRPFVTGRTMDPLSPQHLVYSFQLSQNRCLIRGNLISYCRSAWCSCKCVQQDVEMSSSFQVSCTVSSGLVGMG